MTIKSGSNIAKGRRVPKNAVFTHGQLYVAVSRADNDEGLRIAIDSDTDPDASVIKKYSIPRGLAVCLTDQSEVGTFRNAQFLV
jgi:hypothetical protein